MNKTFNFFVFKTLLILLTFASFAEEAPDKKIHPWNKSESPKKLKIDIEYRYDKIPQAYSLPLEKEVGWSGSYWPSEKGGVSHRWLDPFFKPFENELPTLWHLKRMDPEWIKTLSPIEKFDIFKGDFSYSLTNRVIKTTKKNRKKDWAGICHGWALASLNFSEPKPVTVTSKDGIEIKFGSSDIKGLLSYYMAYGHEADTIQIGQRCTRKIFGKKKCSGMNPASFHIVMGNLLGVQQRGFIADVDPGKEVWNQPVVAYRFEEVTRITPSEREFKKGLAKKIKVKAYMTYVDELQKVPGAADDDYEDHKMWTPILGTKYNEKTTKEFVYILELDYMGKIIGGKWISSDRPDFLWVKPIPTEFVGEKFKALEKIYPIEKEAVKAEETKPTAEDDN
ncbi:hypothetical protein N9N67_09835 [Bacteriovoracaceae bacterium]|nr:hypothetical protein [Bacteriovoracaceae bacterium]